MLFHPVHFHSPNPRAPSMRAIRLLNLCSITLPALLLLASSAFAGTPPAVVSALWGGCLGSGSPNRNMGEGPQEVITVHVKGLSGLVQGAQITLQFASTGGLADAWRYDDAGCE